MDTVVETIGIEWDQERLAHYARPAGPAAAGVFRPAGARMKKFTDASSWVRRRWQAGARARKTIRRRGQTDSCPGKLYHRIVVVVGGTLAAL